ncbi:MAG: F0F1 ATP synthase subunit A [Gammaproteobacteria bacterium]|nr:F0F1 ATP synthase subunit A [Gammaproteobacteria bacterium]
MTFNPDNVIIWQWEMLKINATLVFTWLVMALILCLTWLATRRLSDDVHPSRWQTFMEMLVSLIRDQIRDVGREDPDPYLSFVGTIFLFIAFANLLTIIPGYRPPTGSLSTTAALAICVFLAVPLYGIQRQGLLNYLRQYTRPSLFMLPFNIIGEVSRTIALAVRLFGNMMSGTVVVAVLISITPFLFPIVLQLLGLLTGMIQAYIFAILAMVYISSALVARKKNNTSTQNRPEPGGTAPAGGQ